MRRMRESEEGSCPSILFTNGWLGSILEDSVHGWDKGRCSIVRAGHHLGSKSWVSRRDEIFVQNINKE
jgi:hypothetical protein